MDLSNIQPIHKKFDNELEAEKFFSRLSNAGGKKVDIIAIYPKGSGIYFWFYYDRTKIGYVVPKEDLTRKVDEATKKKASKKTSKKVIKKS